jgi:hypothetical protein
MFVNTNGAVPHDIHADGRGPLVDVTQPIELAERSLVCLVADMVSPPPPIGLPGPEPLS